ncbi:MAG: DnaB-like helicase C-terminal domain-containing protein, partial [Beijerinckiaceae bacterium]
ELDIPVVALAHVNREMMKRDNKRPQIADLHGGSEIEKSADGILFIHREEYWLELAEVPDGHKDRAQWMTDMDQARGKAEIILAKRRLRKGRGVYDCRFTARCGRFDEPRDDESDLFG